MQLLIILALLMCGGASGGKMLSEVRPVLESLGGEEIKQALKSAEEISEVISAVQAFAAEEAAESPARNAGGAFGQGNNDVSSAYGQGDKDTVDKDLNEADTGRKTASNVPAIAFPLAPIANIADRDITYSLSKYFSA